MPKSSLPVRLVSITRLAIGSACSAVDTRNMTPRSMTPSTAAPWGQLLPELLHRCLLFIDDEERCRTIPLVNKAFLANHKCYTPERKQWGGMRPLTHHMVSQLLQIAAAANAQGLGSWTCKPQLVDSTAMTLQELANYLIQNLRGDGGQILSGLLEFLGRMQSITLGMQVQTMEPSLNAIHPGKDLQLHHVSGMQSLVAGIGPVRKIRCTEKELYIGLDVSTTAAVESRWQNGFWAALASLPKLVLLSLIIMPGMDEQVSNGLDSAGILSSVELLTRIKTLDLVDDRGFAEGYGCVCPASFSNLTQLESLSAQLGLSSASCSPILDLPRLEYLELGLFEDGQQPAVLFIARGADTLEAGRGTGNLGGRIFASSHACPWSPPSTGTAPPGAHHLPERGGQGTGGSHIPEPHAQLLHGAAHSAVTPHQSAGALNGGQSPPTAGREGWQHSGSSAPPGSSEAVLGGGPNRGGPVRGRSWGVPSGRGGYGAECECLGGDRPTTPPPQLCGCWVVQARRGRWCCSGGIVKLRWCGIGSEGVILIFMLLGGN